MSNGTDTQITTSYVQDDALEYTRNLYKLVLDWYKNADSKAQILLSLDGAFVAFMTGSVFAKRVDLKAIIDNFNDYTWILLGLMCLCLVMSIICALNCLRSRTDRATALQEMFRKLEKDKGFDMSRADTYPPEVMGYFQIIAELDANQFTAKLFGIDKEFIIRILGSQIHIVSRNVYQKHESVNFGFILAGMTLILFMAGGMSYLAGIY